MLDRCTPHLSHGCPPRRLSYFLVPPQQTVQLTSPKTTVPDVAGVQYNCGETVSTQDLLDAFSIRQASVNAITRNLPPIERESARKKSVEFDLESLQKSAVADVTSILEVKKKFLTP
jgi:hypothetical protein